MKLLFYLIALFTFSISACTTKNHKISQINIKGLDLLNADKKTDVVVEIPNNDTISIIKAKIKIRGGSSIGYDKKNFSLTLKDKFTFNGFHRDKNFVLGASVIDKTFLRNVFCYHFFREWNINNIAPHTSYTELYLDNTYYGFYVLTEKLDVSSLQLDKKTGSYFKEPTVFRPVLKTIDSVMLFDGTYYHQKHPKDIVKHAILDSLKNFLFYSSDSTFENNVLQYFDLQNIIDWHIMLELSNNSDGLQKNFILYQKNENEKYKMALWDCDHSLGRDGDYEYNMLERNVDFKNNILIYRLLESKRLNYKALVQARYKALRQSKQIDFNTFSYFIDNESTKIKPHITKNFEKWSLTKWPYTDNNTFENEIDIIKKFLKLSIQKLDKKYAY